jgi:hypothetical protein
VDAGFWKLRGKKPSDGVEPIHQNSNAAVKIADWKTITNHNLKFSKLQTKHVQFYF